jgi:hypothetical protein
MFGYQEKRNHVLSTANENSIMLDIEKGVGMIRVNFWPNLRNSLYIVDTFYFVNVN